MFFFLTDSLEINAIFYTTSTDALSACLHRIAIMCEFSFQTETCECIALGDFYFI